MIEFIAETLGRRNRSRVFYWDRKNLRLISLLFYLIFLSLYQNVYGDMTQAASNITVGIQCVISACYDQRVFKVII